LSIVFIYFREKFAIYKAAFEMASFELFKSKKEKVKKICTKGAYIKNMK